MRILGFVFALALGLSGCGGSSPNDHGPNGGSPRVTPDDTEVTPTVLTTYRGHNAELNEIIITDAKTSPLEFDFTFQPDRDETLILTHPNSGLAIGCTMSDVSPQFLLYRADESGKADVSRYQGLGPAPVTVTQGERYVVRVVLRLDASCTSLNYQFGIRAE